MVFFNITHETLYAYSRPVFLEPHVLRLRPRCDAAQNLLSFEIDVQPSPAGSSECLDLDGNVVMHVWFDGLTESLSITTHATLHTQRDNPFDYMLTDPRAELLPMSYAHPVAAFLKPYRARRRYAVVERFAKSIARQSEQKTQRFLTALNREIYQGFRQVMREHGDPRLPNETLAQKEGSCRDLAMLFIEACRCLGIAARFVSGYHSGEPDQEQRYLHAWAEVYLPGAGWRGYDPSYGLAVADQNVAIAAAAMPQWASPVTGNVRGDAVASSLRARIDIRVSEQPGQV
jgi:transglutaminase-like putative cysteine protease